MSEPYPDEYPKLQRAGELLQRRFHNTVFTEETMNQFMQAAAELFGEAGWRIGVDWDQAVHPATGESVTLPKIIFQERISPEEETDHNRVQWGVVKGLADGQPGYVRADGSKHEEPRKKLIY